MRHPSARWLAPAAFVAIWMTGGFAFRPPPEVYLLVGIPLSLAFQRWVARRPLAEVWVRGASRLELGRREAAYALALAGAPLWMLVRHLVAREWLHAAWALAAVAGALPAAMALGRARRADATALLRCFLVAGGLGALFVTLPLLARAAGLSPPAIAGVPERLGVGLRDFLCFVPVTFVLEEVTFRGVLDAYAHPWPGRPGLGSALFLSILWGLWHVPVVAGPVTAPTVLALVVLHVAIGLPLTIYWRRSGNLLVPAVVHAFIDGLRDAVLVP